MPGVKLQPPSLSAAISYFDSPATRDSIVVKPRGPAQGNYAWFFFAPSLFVVYIQFAFGSLSVLEERIFKVKKNRKSKIERERRCLKAWLAHLALPGIEYI